MSSSEKFLDWLLVQVPAIVIACTVIWMMWRMIRRLQSRNELLSDRLMQVVELASEERLSITRRNAEEREKLRTDALLQHDATVRSMLDSLERGLLNRLSG